MFALRLKPPSSVTGSALYAPASSAAHGNDVPGPAVEGLAKEVGDALVVALLRHTTQPAFTYVHKWCKGDTVIWANYRSMHAALGHDLNDGPRVMWRTTFE